MIRSVGSGTLSARSTLLSLDHLTFIGSRSNLQFVPVASFALSILSTDQSLQLIELFLAKTRLKSKDKKGQERQGVSFVSTFPADTGLPTSVAVPIFVITPVLANTRNCRPCPSSPTTR
ncbi:hypothetical protein OH76DRAFT_539444 [Lentinus brumalis]|uniref:Uncharacterized protein n=1 Tax=Lentinus brumalis TaxID=2498619 RepID=A0A371CHI7_9APHY|nr:hypothetical protein OH76DRAFT_539444 [Polyporus brumalis]